MKIRNGFVSNSSSSSFLILKQGEMNKEELQKYLFGDITFFESPWYDGQRTSIEEAMDVLYEDVQKPVEKERLEDELKYLLYSWCVDFDIDRLHRGIGYIRDSFCDETIREINEFENVFHIPIDIEELKSLQPDSAEKNKGYRRIEEIAKDLTEKLFGKVYLVEYHDDYGDIGAEMEHNVMIKGNHVVRINNH